MCEFARNPLQTMVATKEFYRQVNKILINIAISKKYFSSEEVGDPTATIETSLFRGRCLTIKILTCH